MHPIDAPVRTQLFVVGGFGVPELAGANALVTVGDRIVAVGDHRELRDRFADAAVVDLGDHIVLPGFNDAHMHPSKAAEYGLVANLAPPAVTSLEDIATKLREQARRSGPHGWIQAMRYDHGKSTGGEFMTRHDLDRIDSERPIHVSHISGHFGVLNSRGLQELGITRNTPDPTGGSYRRDDEGEPSGVLVGRAQQDTAGRLPELDLEARLDGLEALGRDLAAAGLTSVTDAIARPATFELFRAARERRIFPLRTNLLLWWQYLDLLEPLRLGSDFGDEWLRLGGVKAVFDGAVAGGTCWMCSPFDGTDERGMLLMSEEELRDVVMRVDGAGTRLAVHANGDAAIGKLLDVFDETRVAHGRARTRHRIEHASIVDDEIVARIAALDLIVVPLFSYVWFHGEKILRSFGHDRLPRTIACRSMIDAGITLAGSSDFGAGPYPPLANIQAVVTRRDEEGRDLDASQSISVDEAIHAYTAAGAEASGEAHQKGRLAPGYLADLVALDEDPRDTDPDGIAEIAVAGTWVGATMVHAAN